MNQLLISKPFYFEYHSPQFNNNPYPIYEKLRHENPVLFLENENQFIVTRFDDVFFALTNHEIFGDGTKSVTKPEWLSPDCRFKSVLISEDPPLHGKTRAAINDPFTTDSIKKFEHLMRENADLLKSKLAKRIKFDFMTEFSFPYIWGVLQKIFGFESSSLEEIRGWVALIMANTPQTPPKSHITAVEHALRSLSAYLNKNIYDHRSCPRQDGISHLLNGHINERSFSEEELRSALILFITAGLESSAQLLGSAIVELMKNPKALRELTSEPSLIPAFVEELLRMRGSTHWLLRTTRMPVTLQGITIPENALISLVLASANRDSAIFSNPNVFDMTRKNIKKHVAFGCGPHVCIGANLARMEIKIALETLLPLIERFKSSEECDLEWIFSHNTRTLKSLPIQLIY